MTQKDKDLLLKDLCARLPYAVKVVRYVERNNKVEQLIPEMDLSLRLFELSISNQWFIIKPYLRPLSSMTEEENNERKQLGILCAINDNHEIIFDGFGNESVGTQLKALDWLNAHHFDYRGLIERGLALKALDNMYSIESKEY